tara:strand:- start:283 stop:471 length:189 start_codon:yes stop_codon:yes gene_type:complete
VNEMNWLTKLFEKLKKIFVIFFDYNRNNKVELWEFLFGTLFPLTFYGIVVLIFLMLDRLFRF